MKRGPFREQGAYAQVADDIQRLEVAVLIFCWACLSETVRPVGKMVGYGARLYQPCGGRSRPPKCPGTHTGWATP